MLVKRRAQMQDIRYGDDGLVYAEYLIPTRGMLGFRQLFLTLTRGTGVFNTLFHDFVPMMGEIDVQEHGSLIALETGPVRAYALQHLQQRGDFFVKPGDEIYSGQVVGQHIRNEDLVLNACKTKNLTGHRATPKAIVSASCGIEPGRVVEYKPLLDAAIDLAAHKPDHCVILQRPEAEAAPAGDSEPPADQPA